MNKKIIIGIIVIISIACASIVTIWILINQTSEKWSLDLNRWNEFLFLKAELKDNTTDPQVYAMAQLSSGYINSSYPYNESLMEKPSYKYFHVDIFGRETDSFYLVWLPANWEIQTSKYAILYSPGHATKEPRMYYKFQEYAVNRSMALFMPHIYIEGDVPWGYNKYQPTEQELLAGIQPGYHLESYDEHLFINAIVEEYNISALYLHGFSMSGATVMMLSAFDRYALNVSDYAVVNGGHMVINHPFIEMMNELGLTNFFAGESFFLFYELYVGEDPVVAKANYKTDDIIINNGGNMDIESYLEAGHGDLIHRYPYLVNASLNNFTYYADLRLS
ncbi:MAG: hypothetical protein ACFFD2_00080 [Promethearchaeota archaeon]